MARAETIESVGENGGGRNGPLSCYNTCRMELPQTLNTRPGSLSPRTPRGGTSVRAPLLQNSLHRMEPPRAVSSSNRLPYSHPESQGEAQAQQRSHETPLTSSCCPVRNERSQGTASSSSEEEPDSNREEHQEAPSQQAPLPDLLPQNEHASWSSPARQGAARGEAAPQLDVIRVANQLRVIGDEFNTMVFQRAHVAPQWQDWRDIGRGFLNFIAQTLSTLYRLT